MGDQLIGRCVSFRAAYKSASGNELINTVEGTIVSVGWQGSEFYFAIEYNQDIHVCIASKCKFSQTERDHKLTWNAYVTEFVRRKQQMSDASQASQVEAPQG